MANEDLYRLTQVYLESQKSESQVLNEENFYDTEDMADQIDGDLDHQEPYQPSTSERIQEVAAEVFGDEASEYEFFSKGDVKDGEAGICIKISGYYSAAEMRYLLTKTDDMNEKLYGDRTENWEVADSEL